MSLLTPHHWWIASKPNQRSFSCTALKLAKSTKQRLKFEYNEVPPYPYGPSQIYKQSNFGLYGTQKIRYGNIVSEKNEIKTRRHWRPNVHVKDLFSESLNKKISVRITTRVLRTVRKLGGIDEYLLGEKSARIKELGMMGWKLRWQIMQTPKVKERFRKQREKLGLSPLEEDLLQEKNEDIDDSAQPVAQELAQAMTDISAETIIDSVADSKSDIDDSAQPVAQELAPAVTDISAETIKDSVVDSKSDGAVDSTSTTTASEKRA